MGLFLQFHSDRTAVSFGTLEEAALIGCVALVFGILIAKWGEE